MNPIKRWLGYGLILLFLVTGGFGVASYIKSERLKLVVEHEQMERQKLVEANATQVLAIDTLKKVRESDALVLSALSRDLGDLAARDFRVNQKLELLEKNDVAFRTLLSTVLPSGGCLLDNSCGPGGADPSGTGKAASESADTMRKAVDRAISDREGSGQKQPR